MAKRLSWATRIERAEKRGKFTSDEVRLAANWTKCAVGEKHEFPASSAYAADWDFGNSKECELGIEFCRAVQNDEIPEAKRLYAEIQALP